ncbi:MBL fold metallo-hydrolase [Alicyclobacillaceae bacterium I2511]|nr:MBL fold metallo-hydrolase [Alicyclobacillaceae bacterium I2511]
MEITKNVHLLTATKGSYSYLVLGNEPVLVDTSFPGRTAAILHALKDLGMEPKDLAHIVLTHHDVDHVGNAKALAAITGADLWASAEEVPFIEGRVKERGARKLLKVLVRVDRPQGMRTYEAGKQIGGLEVIPTPGHTPGHVSLLFGDVLLAGDLVQTKKGLLRLAPGLFTWDKETLRRSLRKVGKLQFHWVCPAHGEPVQRGSQWETLA